MTSAENEKSAAGPAFMGTWHIYEMELWDEDYINMEVQAFIEIRQDNLGSFQFGVVSGDLDGNLEGDRFVFTWEGGAEMDPVSGSGWVELKSESEAEGLLKLHLGDRSHFRARRAG